MSSGSNWCPICNFPTGEGRDEKSICSRCGGEGMVRCSQCLCLECGGTGRLECHGCDDGREPCPDCGGAGKQRKMVTSLKCRRCDATGIIYHEECSGRGSNPCPACSGLGHLPDCPRCGSTGRNDCPACFGTGLYPSTHLLSHAEAGSIAHLLMRLPVVEDTAPGELLDLDGAVYRATSLLALYHWSPVSQAQDREHQLIVLRDRLHFQVAILTVASRTTTRIDYKFLTVARTGKSAFRAEYAEETKAWR